jgi:hypothetical protein
LSLEEGSGDQNKMKKILILYEETLWSVWWTIFVRDEIIWHYLFQCKSLNMHFIIELNT